MDAPIPFYETTKKPTNFEEEKNLLDFTLQLNKKAYNGSLKHIQGDKIKITITSSNYIFQMYEKEFNLYDFQNINRNFKVYDNINEIENDLIDYIKQNKIKITEVNKNKITLELTIIAQKDNIVNIKIERKENKIAQFEILYEEFEKKK